MKSSIFYAMVLMAIPLVSAGEIITEDSDACILKKNLNLAISTLKGLIIVGLLPSLESDEARSALATAMGYADYESLDEIRKTNPTIIACGKNGDNHDGFPWDDITDCIKKDNLCKPKPKQVFGAHFLLYKKWRHSCEIDVKDQDITHYWDEWKFTKGGCKSSRNYWDVCMKKIDCGKYNKDCKEQPGKRCENNEFDSLKIWRAENGTEIRLYDNSAGVGSDDDFVIIEFLKDFDFDGSKWLRIEGLEKSETTEYYKMTYYPHNGLNGEVSQLFMHFANRPEWS